MSQSNKSYLGDGVYADLENGMIKLTAENGIAATNTIFLELDVYQALVRYVEAKIVEKTKGEESE